MIRKFLILLFISTFFIFFTNSAQAQSCSAPAIASGVTVEYPGCNGSSCDLVQASCAWASQADAASFNVTVTEVETGTVIKNNESQLSTTTKILFNITQGRTYKCDVVAVSACGGLATATSDQLLCEADALIDTPTPSPTTVVSGPTATTAPPTATPTIAPPGDILQTATIIGGILIAIVGGILLFAL